MSTPGLSVDWLSVGSAILVLETAGKRPEEAIALLQRQLAAGALTSRAAHIQFELYDGKPNAWADHEVPNRVWRHLIFPPLGHSFWRSGNLDSDLIVSQPRLEDMVSDVLLGVDHLSLDPPPMRVRLQGVKVWREGILALCRSFDAGRGRGRKRGTGGYEKDDEPLVAEMHRLRLAGDVTSIHAAAEAVAVNAKGNSQFASKVRRLVDRYRTIFPD